MVPRRTVFFTKNEENVQEKRDLEEWEKACKELNSKPNDLDCPTCGGDGINPDCSSLYENQ